MNRMFLLCPLLLMVAMTNLALGQSEINAVKDPVKYLVDGKHATLNEIIALAPSLPKVCKDQFNTASDANLGCYLTWMQNHPEEYRQFGEHFSNAGLFKEVLSRGLSQPEPSAVPVNKPVSQPVESAQGDHPRVRDPNFNEAAHQAQQGIDPEKARQRKEMVIQMAETGRISMEQFADLYPEEHARMVADQKRAKANEEKMRQEMRQARNAETGSCNMPSENVVSHRKSDKPVTKPAQD